MPSKKQIQAAVKSATGHDVVLEKHEGIYYWHQPIDYVGWHPIDDIEEERCLHVMNLDSTVEWFVDDYKGLYPDGHIQFMSDLENNKMTLVSNTYVNTGLGEVNRFRFGDEYKEQLSGLIGFQAKLTKMNKGVK